MIHADGCASDTAREVKFTALDLKGIDLDGVFEGYASLFHKEDMGRDVVVPGAFRDSLAERGASGIRMLFQHDPNQPIGVWLKLYEDARGLFARGRLMLEVGKAREVLALIRAGAIDGLSIGFRVVRGLRDPRTGVRRLEKIDLWEISIVTFPMLREARVASLKSGKGPFGGRSPTEREFERWLMQDAGFTRREARAVMREGHKGLRPLKEAGRANGWEARLLERMSQAARLLRTINH
ncbi:MAG TPA: HK97 family phage prohead protease [Hyphomicrobiaceae bacterium]|nr:HK97 family phage prohead protease [Hyphomicrobiaceae bacterium]